MKTVLMLTCQGLERQRLNSSFVGGAVCIARSDDFEGEKRRGYRRVLEVQSLECCCSESESKSDDEVVREMKWRRERGERVSSLTKGQTPLPYREHNCYEFTA